MNPKVRAAVSFLEKNLHRAIHLAEVSQLVRLSHSRLSHLFKSEVGMSLTQYVKKARMEKACELLETSFKQAKEISVEVG
jgi:AraC family transcriptional regulator of arabinose operon